MSKSLDFNKIKKTHLTVTLADEDNTVLMIGTPTKAIMDDLIVLKDSLDAVSDDDSEAIDTLYGACARVISRNKNKKIITKEYLEELFDIEDIIIFFNAYMNFVTELANVKN